MGTAKRRVRLGTVEKTLLWTVYMRVLDFRNTPPLVGDVWAVDVLDHLEFDRRILWGVGGDRNLVLLRARRIDAWARRWISAHPGGTVLHLACGPDSRALRLGSPPEGRWFDLDLPNVAALRRDLLPEPAGYRLLSASVTDAAWLDEIPSDAPVLVIAEGLVEYLSPTRTRLLLDRLVGHFPHGGEIVFDSVPGWVGATARAYGVPMFGMEDPRTPERWNPHLRLVRAHPLLADHADVPEWGYRTLYRALNACEATRAAMRLNHYRFEGSAGSAPDPADRSVRRGAARRASRR
ncbi:class I SAM-dependent methyltransferase [Nocardiopsis sp. MG754419]|uniref:class I SAM-dependent methyltransferase n=1 Tax=Nocardiopsis sp. MG754419 TaxID=2259865 RepID=UPI001BA5831E|nr:class I SAM-dependent methyltransferase [Nocardiopsis sp. MG754419]MBR8744198.1 class I SAM-dependent methyltransferase [Nocardiopsis sp. MG754419]